MPISTPVRLKISGNGWLIKPKCSNVLFTTPPGCSSTYHAVVRTSSEVQNGTITSSISRLLCFGGRFASRYATG